MRDSLGYPIPQSERISIIYLERCTLERDGHSLVSIEGKHQTIIPVAKTSVLMLGPGTSVTHAAVALAALEGCQLLWTGDGGVRLYSSGNPRANSEALVRQSVLFSDPSSRLAVARKIFKCMFDEDAPDRRSIDQLRGMEGFRVKTILQNLAAQFGIVWEGRQHNSQHPINLAISTATAALYGVTEAAVLALGYSPAIGFVHSGDPRSFVFDVADTLKFKTVVPLAFRLFSESNEELEPRVRIACRDLFFKEKIPARIVSTIQELIDADGSN
jgi:CRISP-associated protein Cas1